MKQVKLFLVWSIISNMKKVQEHIIAFRATRNSLPKSIAIQLAMKFMERER